MHEINMNKAKESAAIAALDYIQEGMLVGLGTGSTANYFIQHLAEKCSEGFHIEAVATSTRSSQKAKELGIPLVDINKVSYIDIDVDGADEVDSKNRLIKGGGGAALREKIVASISREFIVIADEGKNVQNLGKFPLPVEILPFGHHAVIEKINKQGYSGKLRIHDGGLYVTENGNYIYDVSLPHPCLNPEKDDENIKNIVGVIETGFFLNMATRIIIGFNDGHVEIRK